MNWKRLKSLKVETYACNGWRIQKSVTQYALFRVQKRMFTEADGPYFFDKLADAKRYGREKIANE